MKNKDLSIAVIPARGGSKRIPRKNVIDFCGKPMIAWTIEAAINAGVFDRIIVSTDDLEIAEVARTFGAEVPFLRTEASDDVTPVSVATMHALDQAEGYWDESYGVVTQLMANCPLRTATDIRQAFEHFTQTGVDFQLTCFEYGFMNPWWAHTLGDQGEAVPVFPDALKQRSQDLPKLYCPTGAIWMSKVNKLRTTGTFYGPGYAFFPISWQAALDIDTEDDFVLTEAVFEMQSKLVSKI